MWYLRCPRCGWVSNEGKYHPFCPRCGSALKLEGRLEGPEKPVLGEGNTPLVFKGGVFFKLEYLNPSGSFKDRGTAVSLWLAKRLGYSMAVEDSSGNTALSVATYGAALGIRVRLHMPATAAPGKIGIARALGAEVVAEGSRADAAARARSEASESFYVAHLTSPVFTEGMKAVGHELCELKGHDIFVPASSGTLLIGLWEGLKECGGDARLIAVQAAEAASLKRMVRVLAEVGGPRSSLADALVVKSPPRIDEMADAVRSSGGGVVVVGDDALRPAIKEVLRMGFIVEPSSAAVWAAYKALKESGDVGDAVLVLTGSGLKYRLWELA